MLPNITYELLKRGYSERDIRKILGENFLRAFAEAERVAHSHEPIDQRRRQSSQD